MQDEAVSYQISAERAIAVARHRVFLDTCRRGEHPGLAEVTKVIGMKGKKEISVASYTFADAHPVFVAGRQSIQHVAVTDTDQNLGVARRDHLNRTSSI